MHLGISAKFSIRKKFESFTLLLIPLMIIMIIKILNVSFTSKNSDNKIEVTIIEDV